jgi:hypothetical protein
VPTTFQPSASAMRYGAAALTGVPLTLTTGAGA